MSKLLRFTGWLLLTALLVWLAVIGYWKMTGVRPDTRDLTLYLGVLPLGVFAVLVLLKRGLTGAHVKAASFGGDNGIAESAAAAPEGSPAQVPMTRLGILASALRLPAGHDASAVLAQLSTPSSPALHGKLRDASGFPIFASWSEDTDSHMAEAAFGALTSQRFDEEHLRALALLMPVAQDLLLAAANLGLGTTDPDAVSKTAASTPNALATVFVPDEWTTPIRDAVAAWLADEAQTCGLSAEKLEVRIVPTSSPGDVWAAIRNVAAKPEAAASLHLMLACRSQVGERSVQRLDRSGLLMSSRQPEGLVPGEGAAGLLLQPANDKDAFDHPTLAILTALGSMQHGVSWQLRTAAAQIENLLAQTLGGAPDATADSVKALLSDADMRKSRATAVAGFFTKSLHHLDAEADCLSTGSACGYTGIVSPLSLLALAAAKAVDGDGPVLALTVAEPDQRAMALVLPPNVPASNPQADVPTINPQAT